MTSDYMSKGVVHITEAVGSYIVVIIAVCGLMAFFGYMILRNE